MNCLKLLIFILLVPCSSAIFLPYVLAKQFLWEIDIGYCKWTGMALIAWGIGLYSQSAFVFLLNSISTPIGKFTKKIKLLFKSESIPLIYKGLYRFSRNPMYLGVISVVLGEGIYFEKLIVILYALALFLFFHLIIKYVEEPHLQRKYGDSYNAYLKKVPRWA